MNDTQLLEEWYQYAARTTGSIGAALRTQRKKAFLFQEQQRAIIGIQDVQYNSFWLHLQAMPLPRPDQFTADLARIVAKVESDTAGEATVDVERLGELIRAGLE